MIRAALAEPTRALESVRTERARRSLSAFIQQAWHIIEPRTPYHHGWHIDAICYHLEAVTANQIQQLVINIPPRHMKSTIVSQMWPAWEWIRYPERRFLCASYAQNLATRDSRRTRDIITSSWYQQRWRDSFRLTTDQNTKMRFDNDKSGYRIATSVGGSTTGEGGDRVVVDDPIMADHANSDTIRSAANQWWDETMSTRINNPKTGALIIVMQRLHQQDLTGHVLDQGGYVHLRLPAEYDGRGVTTWNGWTDPRTEPGELLWKTHVDAEDLGRLKKKLGSYGVAGQLQQDPAPRGGGEFRREWWGFWQRPGDDFAPVEVRLGNGLVKHCRLVTLPDGLRDHRQSWDATFKDSKSSDRVAGLVGARNGADVYLLDGIADHMDIVKTMDAITRFTARWPQARRKLVEDKANGPAIISLLKSKIAGLIAVGVKDSKVARARAVVPSVEAGNVYLPHPSLAEWVSDFLDEISHFPRGEYDDYVDAFSQMALDYENASFFLNYAREVTEGSTDGGT